MKRLHLAQLSFSDLSTSRVVTGQNKKLAKSYITA